MLMKREQKVLYYIECVLQRYLNHNPIVHYQTNSLKEFQAHFIQIPCNKKDLFSNLQAAGFILPTVKKTCTRKMCNDIVKYNLCCVSCNFNSTCFCNISSNDLTRIWWVQLSTAIVFGLIFATILTLIVTPSALMLRENIKTWYQNKINSQSKYSRILLKSIDLFIKCIYLLVDDKSIYQSK